MWAFFALSAALLQSSARLINQYAKIPGIKLTLYVKAFHIIYIIPVLFFVDWPKSVIFYIISALTAPLVIYQDKSIYDFTARFGAGSVTRIEPLSVPFVFICWILINPDSLIDNMERPFHFFGICSCIMLSVFFAIKMRHCPVNLEAIKAMLPIVLIMGTINIMAKISIDYAPNYEGVAVYIFVQTSIVILIGYFLNRKNKKLSEEQNNIKMIKVSFLMSVVIFSVIILRMYGFILSENPAYVTAVMLTGPFWILVFYKAVGHKENSDIRPGIGIVLSAILLTILVTR